MSIDSFYDIFLYKGVETSSPTRFKFFEGKPERKSSNRTISASGRFESLEVISELDTR